MEIKHNKGSTIFSVWLYWKILQQEQKAFGFRVICLWRGDRIVTKQKEPKQANVEIRGIFHLFKILKFVAILIFERSGSRVGSNLSQNLKRKNVKGSCRNRRLTFVGLVGIFFRVSLCWETWILLITLNQFLYLLLGRMKRIL